MRQSVTEKNRGKPETGQAKIWIARALPRVSSALEFECNRRQGRQLDEDRMLASHPLSIFALHAAEVADVAAAVRLRIGVNDPAIKSRAWHAETIIIAHYRRRVHHKDDNVAVARFAHERNYAVLGIVKIDPFETIIIVVLLL